MSTEEKKIGSLVGSILKGITTVGRSATTLLSVTSSIKGVGRALYDLSDGFEQAIDLTSELSAQLADENNMIDALFGRLTSTTKGTQEYDSARSAIVGRYGSYLQGMGSEIESLEDVAGAYEAVKNAARESVTERMRATKPSDEAADSPQDSGDNLDKLLKDYQTYVDRRREMEAEYRSDIDKLKSKNETGEYEGQIQRAEDKLKAALVTMDEEEVKLVQKSSAALGGFFESASSKSTAEILKITKTAADLFDYLSATSSPTEPTDSKKSKKEKKTKDVKLPEGFTAEQMEVLRSSPQYLDKIAESVTKMNSVAAKENPFAALAESVKELFTAGKSDESTEMNLKKLGESAAASTKMVGGLAGGLSDMFAAAGNDEAAEAMDTVQSVMTSVSNIAGGFASGGLVGGIGAALGEAMSWATKAFAAEAQHKAALKVIKTEQLAQERELNLLLMKQNLLYTQGKTIFGNDGYGKAANSIRVMKSAVSDLNGELTGLSGIEIKTGHEKTGLFGWGKGKDVYSSMLSAYPELIDQNGKFNASLAETIMNTRVMSDEDKARLQNMINLSKQAESALEEVKTYLTGIFGKLGNTMSDALANAFTNGTDAAKAFSDSVGDMLENLAKQMVYSVTLAPLMEGAQKKMLEVMEDDSLDEEQKFKRQAEILSGLTKEAIGQQEKANELYKIAQDAAAKEGIDIFKPDEEEPKEEQREAAKRGIATASQESVDENNGLLTAIQIHTSELNTNLSLMIPEVTCIKNSVGFMKDNAAVQLDVLYGIRENTAPIAAMKSEISAMKNDINTLVIKGITIRS